MQMAGSNLPDAVALLLSPCHLAVQAAQDVPAWQAATADLAQQLQVVAQQQAQGSAHFAAQLQGLDSSHLDAATAATSLQTQVTGQAAQLAGLEAVLATLQEQMQEHRLQGQRAEAGRGSGRGAGFAGRGADPGVPGGAAAV